MICLGSALAHWDLSDEIPTRVDLAVPAGSHRPQIDYPPTRVHVFGASNFGLGRIEVAVGQDLGFRITDPERTVVDCFRQRHRLGVDLAVAGLRRYLRRPRPTRPRPRTGSGVASSHADPRSDAGAAGMSPVQRDSTAGRAYLDLQQMARRRGRPTQELLLTYVLERFLFRLSRSAYRDGLVLKGGMLLAVLGSRRPTGDVDLLARAIDNDVAAIADVVRTVLSVTVDDGVTYQVARDGHAGHS